LKLFVGYYRKDMVSGQQIAEKYKAYIDGVYGDVTMKVFKPNSIDNADKNSFSWANDKTISQVINGTKKMPEGILIATLNDTSSLRLPKNSCIISTKTPRLLYVKILDDFFISKKELIPTTNAIVSSNSKIGESTTIGYFSIIHEYVEIGKNCKIGNNVTIKQGVKIGDNVVIQDNTVIGSEVMSFVRDIDNSFLRFHTLGNVIIENNVEIGSNVTIVSSSLGSTIIGFNTKINSNSYIGSGVVLGNNNYIASGVNINGSCVFGNDNFIGSGSTIRNKVKVANFINIGSGSNVISDLTESESTYLGNPAKLKTTISKKKLF
jgi:UDP-3-O-[3-hydroxymyristoyl] glucosamine N-acyltransferase